MEKFLRCVMLLPLLVASSSALSTSYAYIASGSHPGKVAVIDVITRNVGANAIVVEGVPSGISVSPDGQVVYVAAASASGAGPGTLYTVDAVTQMQLRATKVGSNPRGVAVSPDGSKVYVSNSSDANVSVIDANTGLVTSTVTVGGSPHGVAVSPDGAYVYVAMSEGLAILATSSSTVVSTVVLGRQGSGVVVSPRGDRVYLASTDDVGGTAISSIVTSAPYAVDTTMFAGKNGRGVALTPDGSRLYVANSSDNTLSSFDPRTGSLLATIAVGRFPIGVAVDITGTSVFVTNGVDATVSIVNALTNVVTTTLSGFSGAVSFGSFLGPDIGSTAQAIEYFNEQFGHYFVTASRDEIRKLDKGDFVGWRRTGLHFGVGVTGGPNSFPVCRFFTIAFSPKSSHFYAPRGLGCEQVEQNRDWQFEGEVFFSALPGMDGTCPAGTVPVFRLYNNGMGGAPNHRFTTETSVRQKMIADGYVAEGRGEGVGMCSTTN